MRLRSFGPGFSNGRRLSVEALERRAMLAGNVNAFVSGDDLIIRGDNNDNIVVVTQVDDGEYIVFGLHADEFESLPDADFHSGATSVTGGADASDFFGVEGARLFTGVDGVIDIDTKKGDDIVLVGNSLEDVDILSSECLGFALGSGSGESAVDVEPAIGRFLAPQSLILNTGDGNDSVVVNADVRMDAVINTGKGFDGVAFGSPLSAGIPELQKGSALAAQQIQETPSVGDDLVIITGSQEDHVCVHGAVIHDELNIQTNDGSDEANVEEVAAGHMAILTGNHDDIVDMTSFFTQSTVVIDTGAGNDNVFMESCAAGVEISELDVGEAPEDFAGLRTHAGYVTVVTGAGNDEFGMSDLIADGVQIDTGAGNDGLENDAFPTITIERAVIENHLNIFTGAGNDLMDVGQIVANSILIDAGTGNDGTIMVHNVAVKSDLVVMTGAGADSFYIYSDFRGEPSNIGENLVVNAGAGNDDGTILDQNVGNNLNVILGAGNDEVNVQGVSGTMEVHRNLLVDAGAGNDSVGLFDIDVEADAFVLLGAGNDLLGFISFDVAGNALIDAGTGHDFIHIDFGSETDGTLTIFMGAGNDTLEFIDSFAGKLRAFGGSGSDIFDNNNLGIDANGDYDFDNDGEIDAVIREFEELNKVVF